MQDWQRAPFYALSHFLQRSDGLDLDQGASGQCRNLKSAAGREGSLKMLGIDLVHRSEIGDVGQKDRGLNDVIGRSAGSSQQVLDVCQRLLGLLGRGLGKLAVCGIDAQLTRKEQHVAALNCRGIGSQRCGGVVGNDCFFGHDCSCLLLMTIPWDDTPK